MSITVDTVNLRFNVTPDYKQQQLQRLQDDLKQSQKEAGNARKELDKYTQKVVNLQDSLSSLRARRAELARQKTLTTEESKEFDKLTKSIEKAEDELLQAKEGQAKWNHQLSGSLREMQGLEKRMQEQTRGVNLYNMSLNQLRDRQKDLNMVLNNINPNNEAYADLKKELDEVSQRMKELRQASLDMHEGEDLTALSANELSERLQALNAAFRDCNPEDEDFHRYADAIKETQSRLDLLNEATREAKKETLNFHNETKLADLTLDELHERLSALQTMFRRAKPNSPEYQEYAEKIHETKERIDEMNDAINKTKISVGKFDGKSFFSKLIGAETDFGSVKSILTGNLLVKGATMIFDTISEYASRAFSRVRDLVTESVQAARAAQGIAHAFSRLDQPGLLDNLRKATRGTVSDMELMKAAVQAQDFRLPLDQLGKYLEFARLKAQQTGQSVDYMTNSIVTGLGRKSVMILDNLGISAAEIKEEMEGTGDMAVAVGNIIDRQLAQTGEHFETAAERETRATTDVANAQLKLGQQMEATFGIGASSMGELQAKAETFILNGLTKLIVYCQNLYDRLASVRVVVEGVKIVFDTLFKVCEAGFYGILDTVRIVGRTLMDVGGLIESVFTAIANRDFSPIEHSWKVFTSNLERGFSRLANHASDIGTRWGENFVESIDAVTGKAKVKAPDVEPVPTVQNAVREAAEKPEKKASADGRISPISSDDSFQRDLAAREQAYREYENQLRQMYIDQLLTEDEYRQESLQAEKDLLTDKIALQELYGKESSQTQGQLLDLLIKESNEKQKEAEKKLKDDLAKIDADSDAATRDLLKKQLDGELKTEEEYNRLKLQSDIDYQRQRLEILRAAGVDTAQAEQQLLQLMVQQHRQSEADKTAIDQAETEKRQQMQQAAADSVNNLLSSASSLFSAMQQRETAAVEKRYKSQIAALKKQGKDTTRLEEQQEQEKAAIAKKYAQRQFQMQVLQIIANTAQSISKTIAEFGMPWAIPFVAMATAAGAMQLASAKAAADQAAGLYKGGYSGEYEEGYTKKGNPKEEAGVIPVHKNEFVANHKAVANPEVKPVLDVIDRHQKAGDIAVLDAGRLMSEAYGRYEGGYVRRRTEGGERTENTPGVQDGGNSEQMEVLREIARNTANSMTVRDLRKEIAHEEANERRARR